MTADEALAKLSEWARAREVAIETMGGALFVSVGESGSPVRLFGGDGPTLIEAIEAAALGESEAK